MNILPFLVVLLIPFVVGFPKCGEITSEPDSCPATAPPLPPPESGSCPATEAPLPGAVTEAPSCPAPPPPACPAPKPPGDGSAPPRERWLKGQAEAGQKIGEAVRECLGI